MGPRDVLYYLLQNFSNSSILSTIDAGWSSLAARRAHNPKVAGSNPAPATKILYHGPREGFFVNRGKESGLLAHFLFMGMQRPGPVDLKAIMLPLVEGMGLAWVGLELQKQAGTQILLKLFVDKQGGLSVQDCMQLSRQINGALGVACVDTHYNLEVSSPGLDRRLFEVEQCLPYMGRSLRLKLRVERAGKRHVQGCLEAVEGQLLQLRMSDGLVERIDFATIAEARLVPEYRSKG